MAVSNGTGRDNGVYYTWSSTPHNLWNTSYECRIQKCFLDAEAPKNMTTSIFEGYSSKWRLRVDCGRNAGLGVFVVSENDASVTVSLMITLVNHRVFERNVVKACRLCYSKGEVRGKNDICSINDIKNRQSGFLLGNTFTIKLFIRIMSPEVESSCWNSTGNFGTFTWSMKHLERRLRPLYLVSEKFVIGQTTWVILMILEQWEAGRYSVELYLYDCALTISTATFRATFFNHISSVKNLTLKEITYRFVPGDYCHGLRHTTAHDILSDESLGFVKNGWVTVTVSISVWNPNASMSHVQARSSLAVTTDSATEGVCVICYDKPSCCGVVHGTMYHECYCADCVETAKKAPNPKCPLCHEAVTVFIDKAA